ncbi:dapper homolog 2 [Eublepharis macularius]|uniref:Dapper homolog 2 n=1 Tax=Eublepharis macularius TaxID=481883 RepID=A0AA97LFG6_EUBMA|nr:dapper homolog 2 [Eublepharis macularius]
MLPARQQQRPGGWDRCRISERLQAALAGLQELQVLREKQRALVSRALAMQRPAEGSQATSKEQRLEATLAALKEQLARLRRQDVGLKSHLDQLDQQISELKLDVGKTSIDCLDSDSRPSSGFYELSDGGSCSLSNSCTSVFSESISSSHASLLSSTQHPKTCLSIFDYRPKSADETTVHHQFQKQGIYSSDGCQIKACPDISGTPNRSRPRPVSTGDLERLTTAGAGFPRVTDPTSLLLLCPEGEIQFCCVDSKYQSDLVSKSGNDVYPYPSPLHAVALQSPLFSLAGPPSETEGHPLPNRTTPNAIGPCLIRTRPVIEPRPGGYINKLLQLTRYRGNDQVDAGEGGPTKNQPSTMHQRLIIIPSTGGVKINSSGSQLEKQGSSLRHNKAEGKLQREMPEGECVEQQGTVQCVNTEQTATVLHAESSSAVNSGFPTISSVRDSPLIEGGESSLDHSSSSSQLANDDSSLSPPTTSVALAKKTHKKAAKLSAVRAGGHELLPQGEFVHAKFVPAESHQVRVRFANSKMKSVKVRRRNSEKVLRPAKQTFYVEKPRGVHHVPARLPVECSLPQRQPRGKYLVRRPTFAGEATGRSCSESSLYPVPFRVPQVPTTPELYQASANAMYSFEAAYIDTKKKQRKWQSTVEISAKTHVANISNSFALGPPRHQAKRAGLLRAVSMRSHSKHHYPFRPVTYAKSESDHSEYSAECASLFHSTIAETSEGEGSDYTANCFGDSESSESDSEGSSKVSSLTLDYDDEGEEHELVWPNPSLRQSAVVQPSSKSLPPVPRLCRIKASKALKKKIRRFQPASLKVMTMV